VALQSSFFAGLLFLLSTNQQDQSTEGKIKYWLKIAKIRISILIVGLPRCSLWGN